MLTTSAVWPAFRTTFLARVFKVVQPSTLDYWLVDYAVKEKYRVPFVLAADVGLYLLAGGILTYQSTRDSYWPARLAGLSYAELHRMAVGIGQRCRSRRGA